MSTWDTATKEAVRRRYEEALESFVARVKQDRSIVAAILYGSLAYDEVWEKSDIDLMLIGRDDKAAGRFYALVENGIALHAQVIPRSKFRAGVEGNQDTWTQSILARSTLLFSSDESIQEYYENVHHVGSRDREMQILAAVSSVISLLTKAEKWLIVKNDPIYSFTYIIHLMHGLAEIEVLWHADVPGREVIQQALAYNPDFFTALYTDLAQGAKDAQRMRWAIQQIRAYLDERRAVIFKPILGYLSAVGGVRSASEIEDHLKQRSQMSSLSVLCEWLADEGILQQMATPLRLTAKSRVTLDEAAYYYDGGDDHDAH
jgi:uncharacterized protein